MRTLAAALAMAGLAGPAWAESHAVSVRNGGSETIRAIQIGPAGSLGENRMRSQLPPGAEARITYSTGCTADIRVTYVSGRTEEFAAQSVCTDPRLVTGSGTAGAAAPVAAPIAPPPATARPGEPSGASVVPASTQSTAPRTPGAPQPAAAPVKAPVPPWTGRSITRRFGGMD